MVLFPLNSTCGFGCDVVEDAVDAFNLGEDSVCDRVEHGVGDLFDSSCHSVLGVNGADDSGPTLIALFVLYANALEVGDSNKELPYLACKAAFVEFVAEDSICFAERVESVTCDSTKAANAETGTGERLAVNHSGGKTESSADHTNLILEEKLYGLNELERHIFGQAAYVMVGFNGLFAVAFENVGVDSTLSKEGDAFKLVGFFVEYLDKFAADYLTLCFGIGNTRKKIEEAICCVNVYKVSIKLVAEHFDNLFGFALTHKAVVYVYANELFADSFDEKGSNNRRVNTSGKSEKNFFVAYLRTNCLYLFFDKSFCKSDSGYAFHCFGTYVVLHMIFLLNIKLSR